MSEPGQVVIFTRSMPQLWRQEYPEDGILLIFDHDTMGYKKAYEWMMTRWDKTTPLYRMLIPCSRSNDTIIDLYEYDRERVKNPMIQFTGYVDLWPDDTKFKIIPIRIDSIMEDANEADGLPWPCWEGSDDKDVRFLLSTIYRCAYCSDRHVRFPDMFTGLTEVQQYMIDTARQLQLTMIELCTLSSSKFRIELDAAIDQFEKLTIGNQPIVISKPGKSHPVRLSEYENHVPYWLANGPFPISIQTLKEKFTQMILYGENSITWGNVTPSCSPYRIEYCNNCWVSNTPTENNCIFPPYGWTMNKFKSYVAQQGGEGRECSWSCGRLNPNERPTISYPLELHLTFYSASSNLISYPTLQSYAIAWFQAKVESLVKSKYSQSFYDRRIEQEYDYLRTIYSNGKFEFMCNVDGDKFYKRLYVEETLAAKHKRLLDTYGPDHFDYLWNLPIWKLGPNVYYDEDAMPKDRSFATDRWLKELNYSENDQQQQKNKKKNEKVTKNTTTSKRKEKQQQL